MSNQIYRKKNFIITPVSHGYIVINTNKPFKEGHTHLKNLGACKRIINWSIKKKMPLNSSNYIIGSLIRLAEEPKYKNKLITLLDTRKSKGSKPKCIK